MFYWLYCIWLGFGGFCCFGSSFTGFFYWILLGFQTVLLQSVARYSERRLLGFFLPGFSRVPCREVYCCGWPATLGQWRFRDVVIMVRQVVLLMNEMAKEKRVSLLVLVCVFLENNEILKQPKIDSTWFVFPTCSMGRNRWTKKGETDFQSILIGSQSDEWEWRWRVATLRRPSDGPINQKTERFTGFFFNLIYFVLFCLSAFTGFSIWCTLFFSGFTGSNRVLLGFYVVVLGFIGFYWVLSGFTGFYWVFLGFTAFYWVFSGFTGFYWVLLGLIRFYWVLLGFTGSNQVLLGFTGFYLVLLGFTGSNQVLLGFTVFYWALLGLIRFYWVVS